MDVRAAPRRPTRSRASGEESAWRARRGRSPARARASTGATSAGGRVAAGRAGRCRGSRRGRARRDPAAGAPARDHRASASSESTPSTRPDGSSTDAGAASDAHRSPGARYGGRARTRSAVDVPELRTRLGDLDVRVPAAAAEERRRRGRSRRAAAFGENALPRDLRPSAAHGRVPSSACGVRAARATRPRGRARARASRPRRTQDPPAA